MWNVFHESLLILFTIISFQTVSNFTSFLDDIEAKYNGYTTDLMP